MRSLEPVFYEDGASHPAEHVPERKQLKKQLNAERRSAGRALRRDAESALKMFLIFQQSIHIFFASNTPV